MARKRKHPEHVNHERWLVSYADFVTLLFAFFVVMFASSQVDKRKVGKIALAIQVAFQELGVFTASSQRQPTTDTGSLPEDKVQLIESPLKTTNLSHLVPSPNSREGFKEGRDITLQELREELEKALDKPHLQGKIRIAYDPRGLVLSIGDGILFDSGSASVRTDAYPLLDEVTKALLNKSNHVRVEGHTDNVPIRSSRFPSNWELSTARATFIIIYMTQFNFPPNRLSAAGYGEYRPVASNDTEKGRAQNRRVDIVILNHESMRQEPYAEAKVR